MGARVALSSFLTECCLNDMFCFDLLNDHAIVLNDSHDERRAAILIHLLNGKCTSVPSTPSCKLLAHDASSAIHLSYHLCSLLLAAHQNALIPFHIFSLCCESIGLHATTTFPGRELQSKLQQRLKHRKPLIECQDMFGMLNKLEQLGVGSLSEFIYLHGIEFNFSTKDTALDAIVCHLITGACDNADGELCPFSVNSTSFASSDRSKPIDLQLRILDGVLKTAHRKVFSRILRVLNVAHSPVDSIKVFRSLLRKHRTYLRAGGQTVQTHHHELDVQRDRDTAFATVAKAWPQRISHGEKADMIHEFRSLTSSNALKSFTCGSCAESVCDTKRSEIPLMDINLELLRRRPAWTTPDVGCIAPPMPFSDGPLEGVLVDPAGVFCDDDRGVCLALCPPCKSALSRDKLPRFSLANLNIIGPVPTELKDLTLVEEIIVARCRAKLCVVKFQDHRDDVELPTVQRGIKGHVIVFPQHPEAVSNIMPAPLSDIVTPICIIFCGSTKPTLQWLKEKARPLVVRREAVLKALEWLCVHNPLYRDVIIDAMRISALPEQDVLDYNIEHIPLSATSRALVSRYDAPGESTSMDDVSPQPSDERVHFESVVITDVNAHAPSHQLKAAALRHAKRGGSFIEVPHDPEPVNEFFNPSMFPMLYPTLFPYGIGGFEDRHRLIPIGLGNHVKHMLALADKRFQEHYSFVFVVFNVLQRRRLLLHTSLRVNRNNFNSWAQRFARVSAEAISSLTARASDGAQPTATTDEEHLALGLMREVKAISSNIPGSPESRLTMRNEIRGMILSLGVPSFFVTVNPADVYNPIVKFLAGNNIDVDNLLPDQVPTYWEQAGTIARNPCIAAEFFDTYINAFIRSFLQYDPKRQSTKTGILGVTKAYYGCVEAQGRGSLHCHMVVWVYGGLTSNEIRERALADHSWRDRLIEFLDDTVCNVIPADPGPSTFVQSSQHHACAVRGIDVTTNPVSEDTLKARLKDLRNVVLESQRHSHTGTCYKHHRSGNERKCRFNLDEQNVEPKTYFNEQLGVIAMRHLDGMVNNYCPPMSEGVRCNMDLKFMASGDAANSVLFYVTNYMTKTGNRAHVSFGALEVALNKLGDYDPTDTDTELRAKKMLQKCVYAILSHQELSGQQVAAYLKGYGDHYTSHKYRNLYWTAFEKSVNNDSPSPECYHLQDIDSNESEEDVANPGDHQDESDPDEVSDAADEDSPAIEIGDSDPLLESEENEDVTIAIVGGGTVVQCSSQVHDYRFRAPGLSHLSVWQFISSVDKVLNRTSQRYIHSNDTVSSDEDEDMVSHDHDEDVDPDVQGCGPRGGRKGRRSQSFQLHSEHMQNGKRVQRLRSDPSTHYIPVPIGPALPRRDPGPRYAKYCRLMLILFKPWRVVDDLRDAGEMWVKAFDQFMGICTEGTRRVLDNMQVMHECKDAKDIEDRRRRDARRDVTESRWSGRNETEEFAGDSIDDDLLEHLGSVVNYAADRRLRTDAEIIECLNEVQQSGLLSQSERQPQVADVRGNINEIMLPDDLPLEDMWRTAYDDRRTRWKRNLCTPPEPPSAPCTVNNPHITSFDTATYPPAVTHLGMQPKRSRVAIEDVVAKWTLNKEQARAFSLIASHSERNPCTEPLRLYLGGPGGTGKSRVIAALTDYFAECGETRRLRLAAFTGIAAKNINGTTLHTALGLNQDQKNRNRGNAKTRADLIAMWSGVDYLFVDEVSMIGCYLLYQIHAALVEARGCTDPFGGMSLIFAGDFAQLPPVGQTKLFTRTKSMKEAIVFGQLLWRSITTVVMLTQQMRQAGSNNERFVELLSRLRDGRCTPIDFDLLNTRLLNTALDDSYRSQWQCAPVVVYKNAIKDAINREATMAFSRRTGQPVHWYHAVDTYHGKPIEDEAISNLLDTLPSNKTGGRIRALPLVLGMPVIITENFDVVGGIVNGSTGILRKVRYRTDDANRRYLTSCIVELPDATADALPNLPLKHVAVLPDAVEMTPFRHPNSGRSCTLRRYQVPLDAGFAITTHKAQGQTLEKVIVDLASCIGTEAPYVMISRCTSLEGLMVLRPFPIGKLTTHRSQEARDEFRRLDRLNFQTMVECGDPTMGDVNRSTTHENPHAGSVSRITTLFSGPSPPDIGSASQLLSQIWDIKGGNGTSPPILSPTWPYDTIHVGPNRSKRKVPHPESADECTSKRTKIS